MSLFDLFYVLCISLLQVEDVVTLPERITSLSAAIEHSVCKEVSTEEDKANLWHGWGEKKLKNLRDCIIQAHQDATPVKLLVSVMTSHLLLTKND